MRASGGCTVFDLLTVVVSRGLVHFLTWELVRKQSLGGGIWLVLCGTETRS